MAMPDYQIPGRENGITKQPWYWGKLDKEQASSILMEGDHGDFLVRDSARDGEYTLVVRKEDKVRNIRIHRWPSGYGLVEDCCDFANVADLIHYLQNNPDVLHRSLPMIDLLHAVAKPESSQTETTYDLLYQLVSRNKDLILQENAYRNHVLQRKETVKRLQQCKTRTAALNTVMSLFEEQLALLAVESSTSLTRPGTGPQNPHDQSLALNRASLHSRVEAVRSRVSEEQNHFKKLQEKAAKQLQEIEDLHPQLLHHQQELTLLRLCVEERGINADYLDLLLKEEKLTNLSHYSRRFWFVNCDRTGAERLLEHRVPGTFLIRPSSYGGHSLTIVCEMEDGVEAPRNCFIYENDGRYGFNTDYCIFPSLEELVVKHQTISLGFYNSALDVCLTYPLNYRQDDDQ